MFEEWLTFVTVKRVKGSNAHDVRLAASCERRGLSHVLTFDGEDFREFAGVDVPDPAAVRA